MEVQEQTKMAADFVLEGYDVNLAFRDSEPYEGLDGVSIHEGDHLHDPCLSYTGERFTFVGSNGGSARGFLIINDCQVVQCTKWTTEDGKSGGETVFYDMVANPTAKRTRWKVQEPGKCTCGVETEQETCYVGKFIHANYYSSDCGVVGSPGSIACDPAKTFTTAEITWDKIEKTGVSLVAILGTIAVALVLFCLCCRCRRGGRASNKAQGEKQYQQKAWAVNDVIVAPAVVNGEKKRGWFGGGGSGGGALKPKKMPEPVFINAAEIKREEDTVQPPKRGWFGGKMSNDLKDVGATADTTPGIIDEEDGKMNKKKFGLFWGGKTEEDMLSTENKKITVIEEPVVEKKRGWFDGSKNKSIGAIEEINKEEELSQEENKRRWRIFGQKKNIGDHNNNTNNNKKATVDSEMSPVKEAAHKGIVQKTPSNDKKDKMKDQPKANKQETPMLQPVDEGVDCTCCGF